jgi:uncharacterized membrane protein YccC
MAPPISAAALPRRAATLFFRHHVENGVSVAACFAAVASTAAAVIGLLPAVLVATGAMCVSIVDQPGRLSGRPAIFAAAVVATSMVSLLAGLAGRSELALAVVVAATSAGMALATAYGRPALTLGIAGVLSLVLGMAVPAAGTAQVLQHSALFAAGGVSYAMLALLVAWAFDDRNRRMFLSEALRAFARFLEARARLYDAAATEASLARVIEAHGAFMERLQPARDVIFTGRPTARRRRWIGGMVALLDAYEAVLSTDADWETLPRAANCDALARIAWLTRAMACDAEGLALTLVAPAATPPVCDHTAALAALDVALGADSGSAALAATRDKLAETARRMRRIADALSAGGDDGSDGPPPGVDLAAFVQLSHVRLSALRPHLALTSPVMRYAIRLTLAMLAGFGVTVALPNYVHGGWVLLTVALIMRASYALTRQRRNDRILGTLAGCAVAELLIRMLPTYGVLAGVVIGVGVAHAFATVSYRVTSFAASLMALLLLHVIEPQAAFVGNRILDTLIGAGLSIAFARMLPSWEWRDLPRLAAQLMAANRAFASEALTVSPVPQPYRLVRKRALEAFTALATATRRLLGEPRHGPHSLAEINALLGANYLFASDVVSVRSLLRIRGHEIDAARAGEMLVSARERVLAALDRPGAVGPPADALRRHGWTEMPSLDALTFLARRLAHIEIAARRLADLASRAAARGD